ncbi:MAG: TolC family protein [Bacteroidales bacterium]|nr:TolC family protein [Bacteroidales bacterium]
MFKILMPNIAIKYAAYVLLLCMPLATYISAGAQSKNDTVATLKFSFNPLVDNIQDKLPPLEVLIDSAVKNAPRIRYEDAEISLAKYRLKEYKRAWTKFVGISSGFSYGNRYNYTSSQTTGGLPSEFLSTAGETFFNVGLYLRMPIFDLINQSNNLNQGKRMIEQNMIRREEMIRETKQEVIFTYQNLLLHQDLLIVKNEAQVTSSLQVKMAEKEFINGKISIAELSRLTQTHSSNLYSYKEDRMLFYRQYLLLEELVGMKFNLLNEIY